MNGLFILMYIVLLVQVICLIGGGPLAPLGYISCLLFITFLFFFFNRYFSRNFKSKYFFPLAVFLLFYYISSDYDINWTFVLFCQFMTIFIANCSIDIVKENPQLKKTFKFFCILFLGVFIVYCYRSFAFMEDNVMALRELVSSKKDSSVIIGGGYGLPYAFSLLIPVICYLLRYIRKDKIILSFFLFFIVMGSILVFYALYMTAIVLLLAGIAISFSYNLSKQAKIILIITAIIVIPSVVIYLPTVIGYLAPEGADVLLRRAENLTDFVAGESISGTDLNTRFNLSLLSIKTFINNPIIGVGWKSGYDFFIMEQMGVGFHAEWFDIFAKYGLFAILLIITIVNGTKDKLKKDNISYIMFLILGFLNPTFNFPFFFTVFFMAPSLIMVYKPQSQTS